jgi:hypothetical protein
LTGSDPDGDAVSFSIQTMPTQGTLLGVAPNLTYSPNANFAGPDSFAFITSDGSQDSVPATVNIVVNPINDPPVGVNQQLSTPEDTPLDFVLDAVDPDGEMLTYSITSPPFSGSLSGIPPNMTYTPNPNFVGSETVTWHASDASSSTVPLTLTIEVLSAKDAPVAREISLSTLEDTQVQVRLSGTDVDGDSLTATITRSPAHGTLTGTTPNFTYTPTRDFFGNDTIEYVVTDGMLTSAPVEVAIEVLPVNDPPVFVEPTPVETVIATDSELLTIEVNAQDPDGDTLTYSADMLPTTATFDTESATFEWIPAAEDLDVYTVTFSVTDGFQSVSQDVEINVTVGDQDGDGIPDSVESMLGLDPTSRDSDGDGISDGEELGEDWNNPRDTDDDGVLDALDKDSDQDGVSDAEEAGDQDLETEAVDSDDDGTPDYRDTDSDKDGVLDEIDNCRLIGNPGQEDSDGDGVGDACVDDIDGDGVADADDDCPMIADPDQLDTDQDGIGDVCDLDDDGDSVPDTEDMCPIVAGTMANGCNENDPAMDVLDEALPGPSEAEACGCSKGAQPGNLLTALLFVCWFGFGRRRRATS